MHSVGRVGAKRQPWSTGHVVQWVDTKSWTRGVGVYAVADGGQEVDIAAVL